MLNDLVRKFLSEYQKGFNSDNWYEEERYKLNANNVNGDGLQILFGEIDQIKADEFTRRLSTILENAKLESSNTIFTQVLDSNNSHWASHFLQIIRNADHSLCEEIKNIFYDFLVKINDDNIKEKIERFRDSITDLVINNSNQPKGNKVPIKFASFFLGVVYPNKYILYNHQAAKKVHHYLYPSEEEIPRGTEGYERALVFLRDLKLKLNDYKKDLLESEREIDLIDVQGFIYYLNYQFDFENYNNNQNFNVEHEEGNFMNISNFKKQIILYGPPGTSKTHQALEIVKNGLTEEFEELEDIGIKDFMLKKYSNKEEIDNRWEIVQFHPNYSYEDFVQGIVTEPTEHGINFKVKDKTFIKLCKNAEKDEQGKPYYLIIDEINRGDISKIFGELILGLEYRGMPIKTTYSASISNGAEAENEIKIPENLYIIGTMNTADKSIAFVDYALRRRFAFIKMNPLEESIRKYYESNGKGLDSEKIIKLFNDLNYKIGEEDFKIGHTYFFATDKDHLDYKLDYEVQPLLDEYWKQNIIEEQVEAKELYRKIISDSNNENS